MPLRLPPLSALRFFEAAGRHQSFKRAAEELNVTPSAISHGIVALEQALGVALFIREPRRLSLTAEGADYLPYISEALSLIAIGTQRLPSRQANRLITVSCSPTIASRWLLPRLPSFKERWPRVSVTVDTSHRQVGFPVDGFDFAIRMSRAPVAGTAWIRLFGERLVPVCTPAYRASLTDAEGRFDLGRATLIHVTSVSEDWQTWLATAGVDAATFEEIDLSGGLRFDTIQLAFEASMAGLGVALGRKPLVDRDLASGALIEAGPETVATETAYWMVSSDGADHRPDLLGFKRWLLEQVRFLEA
jgi:LysR family glycine cleavage system transcriptional activator